MRELAEKSRERHRLYQPGCRTNAGAHEELAARQLSGCWGPLWAAPSVHATQRSWKWPVSMCSIGIAPTPTTVSWNCCVVALAQTLMSTACLVLPSMIRNPGPENETVVPVKLAAVGCASTFIKCSSPNAPSTKAERPAMRQLKLPDAAPPLSMVTLNAT